MRILAQFLNRWVQVNGKGIPQGNSASDLLAKLYLDPVDKGLKNAGFIHLRYVDDFRIFCRTESEAKRALIELSGLLRKRGLNLQSSKTKIASASDALAEIEGIQPVLKIVSTQFEKESIKMNLSPCYAKNSKIEESEKAVNKDDDNTPLKVIKEAFNTYFIKSSDEKFDKTLFHFLLNRLIKDNESYALDYCLSIFEKHPEETSNLLKYSDSFDWRDIEMEGLMSKMQNFLLNFLASKEAVYDYQNYLILEWLLENCLKDPEGLLIRCRILAFDNNRPCYIRAISRTLLGKVGNVADISKIEDQLTTITSDFERAELICCLSKMEKGKRNTMLARIAKGGQFTEMAVQFVKGIA